MATQELCEEELEEAIAFKGAWLENWSWQKGVPPNSVWGKCIQSKVN